MFGCVRSSNKRLGLMKKWRVYVDNPQPLFVLSDIFVVVSNLPCISAKQRK